MVNVQLRARRIPTVKGEVHILNPVTFVLRPQAQQHGLKMSAVLDCCSVSRLLSGRRADDITSRLVRLYRLVLVPCIFVK